ncbi:hypothetical protein GOBAR_AA07540 [Gossypium barbadense]|uniref:Sieve element occlusion C-terminal domain-containing protein n=1 Tax=Gossypium barbadense TaxID=3634 RepID=A0A2P5YC17_GOSBA|nr:hypothetical protein GOBAR_AA07540 [Gossypium barbadense]
MACPTPVSSSSKTSQNSMRNEHWMFDDAMNERIRSTHVPDGRVVDVTPVLQVTRNVLRHIIPNINLSMNGHIDASDDQTNLSAIDGAHDALHKICCELSCKCSRGGDAHATTMAIFNMLSSYSWGAKVVYINVLRRKHVLLLISDLDISEEEIRVLEVVYKERVSSGLNYEIIWLPIVDRTTWNNGYQEKFSTLQSIMSWYTVSHHVAIEPAVIKYIREEWGFVKKPIAVTLNPQGKVLCPNALSMMWIWGNSAFPFSSEKEEEPTESGCFYGGVKMEWIESFTTQTKGVANALDIGIEMVYVGKKNARERVKKITGLIKEKELSHAWEDDNVWFFWNLLESMLYSKTQHGKIIENDVIKQEVMTMLGYDSSKNGWAVFYTGTGEMVKANGEKVLSTMESFDEWEKLAKQMGFIPALRKKLEGVIQHHHCTRLILPGNGGRIPERVQCAECGRPMELNFLYSCCAE